MARLERISDKEREFIVGSCFHADQTSKDVASLLGVREHAARYTRDSLIERGIIRPVYHIDYFRLGYNDFGIYLSRGSENSSGRRRFESQIEKAPGIFWLAKTGGAFQYGMSFVTRNPHNLGSLMSLARPSDSGVHFEKTIGLRLDWTIYPPSYLTGDTKKRPMITMAPRDESIKLDEVDIKVLRALSEHPTGSLAHIARALSMNASSVSYRIEQLRKSGVIQAQRYILNLPILGFNNYRLILVDRGLSAEQRQELFRLCSRHPSVVAFLNCTGDWDFELRFEAESPNEIDPFCQLLYDTFGNAIGGIKTMQQHEVLKHVAFAG